MENNKTLEQYDLVYGSLLEFRKKHRVLRVKTLEDALKTVLIDETQKVSELVAIVCEKMSISNPEEFSFAFDGPLPLKPQPKKSGVKNDKDLTAYLEASMFFFIPIDFVCVYFRRISRTLTECSNVFK